MSQRLARRVVLVGWDAADWKVINPLLDSGQMPAVQSIVENGVRGDLTSMSPMISPLLWTSAMTGHPAHRHGVLSFHEPDPASGTVRPISTASRGVNALWNIASRAGLNSIVLNWPASQPAEPIQGVSISNLFPKVRAPFGSHWPLAAGAVHPPRLRDRVAELRVHPGELSGDDLLPFIPQLARIDQKKDRRPQQLAVEMAEAISIHGAATWLMENEPWDLLAVCFPSIEQLSRQFLPYCPPRLPVIPTGDFELYRDVIPGVYRYHDLMLQRMMQLAGPDTTFVLVSNHGCQTGERRPIVASDNPQGWKEDESGDWRRAHGVFCAAGPGIRRDEMVFGARLLDIVPFVLTLFGLPAGADMPGRILPDAFEAPRPDDRIPSWEAAPDQCGPEATDTGSEEWKSHEALAGLAELGYVGQIAPERALYAGQAGAQRDYTLARIHLEAGRHEEAIPLLEQVLDLRPEPEIMQALAHCYFSVGRLAEARVLINAVLADNRTRPYALLIRANLELAEGRPGEALVLLAQAEQMPSPNGGLQYHIGRAYAAMRRWEDAEQAFARALEKDPEFTAALRNQARALYELGRNEEAASAALGAVALRYEDAESHLILGAALARLRHLERAVQAVETSIRFKPMATAHELLAAIYDRRGDKDRAGAHRSEALALQGTR